MSVGALASVYRITATVALAAAAVDAVDGRWWSAAAMLAVFAIAEFLSHRCWRRHRDGVASGT